jgi:hypothetical protein
MQDGDTYLAIAHFDAPRLVFRIVASNLPHANPHSVFARQPCK